MTNKPSQPLKVALVHDFLIEYGGAERVLEALHEIWPKAPVYTAFYDPKSLGQQADRFKDWDIRTSWGTKLPFWQKLVSPYRIFSKSFFQHFDLSGYDLVISSSNAYMAKAVKVPNGIHICYCHTPPRFLYGYPTGSNWKKNPVLRAVGEVINHFMRVWDFESAQEPEKAHSRSVPGSTKVHSGSETGRNGRVDYFIANSKEVQARIKKFYRRDSTVIYPPVDVEKLVFSHPGGIRQEPETDKGSCFSQARNRISQKDSIASLQNDKPYFLVVSRLVSSKNVDLPVKVFSKIGLPLKVVGAGKEIDNLKKLAAVVILTRQLAGKDLKNTEPYGPRPSDCGPKDSSTASQNDKSAIEFLGDVSDEQLQQLYANSRAVIFPASQEDFGLVPVEAMAAGKPVIALSQGGVLETVVDKKTGVYFEPATTGSLTLALNNFINLEKKGVFKSADIKKHAEKFSKQRFKEEIEKFVKSNS